MEGLGFDLLMMSDHVTVTADVAQRYPEPFYEPFTTLSWLAGITTECGSARPSLVLPYRHPLLVARMAGNLNQLSGGRFVLGVGAGWARQEFDALGVPFTARGRLTDEYLEPCVTWRCVGPTAHRPDPRSGSAATARRRSGGPVSSATPGIRWASPEPAASIAWPATRCRLSRPGSP